MNLKQIQLHFSQVLRERNLSCGPDFVNAKISPPITNEQRLGIYEFAYWKRQIDSLAQDFPMTLELLGQLEFESLCERYLRKNPSTYDSLNELGVHFSKYICENSEFVEIKYLVDLVALEWARVLSYWAGSVEKYDFGKLKDLKEEEFQRLRIRFIPSFRIVAVNWPFFESLDILKNSSSKAMQVLLYTHEGETVEEEITVEEALALARLQSGASIEETFLALTEANINLSGFANWFSHWGQCGIVAHFF